MTELLTAARMRAIEQAAIESGAVTGLELMERAGQGVVEAIFAAWPELVDVPGAPPRTPRYLGQDERRRAVVLCGPGNNGGDGFVVARLLRELGWGVEVFLYGDAARLPPEARVNFVRWRAVGAVRVTGYPDATEADGDAFEDAAYGLSGTDLIVDAVFGIGLTRPATGLVPLLRYGDVEVGMGDRLTPARHVSVDLPSGMFSDEPKQAGYCVWFLADLTVTFHRMKQAHVDRWTARSCGKVVVVDIGLEPWHAAAAVA